MNGTQTDRAADGGESESALIAVASRHGGTQEIAERIATVLRLRGISIDLVEIDRDRWLDDEHDAYIVGSAVYMDRWERPAREFMRANAGVLERHPLWLFSSGPLDDESAPGEQTSPPSTGAPPLGERCHRVFGGRLDRDDLGPFEGVVTRLIGAHAGDYRDWNDIESWAEQIAADIRAPTSDDPTQGDRTQEVT